MYGCMNVCFYDIGNWLSSSRVSNTVLQSTTICKFECRTRRFKIACSQIY